MRPQSIIWFERLYLTSLAIGAINGAMSFDETIDQINANPTMNELGFGAVFVIITAAFVISFSLLIWYLIARKGSVAAKWVLVAFTVCGLFFVPSSLSMVNPVAAVVSLILTAIDITAIYFLFRPDAKEWFANMCGSPREKPGPGVHIK